MILQAKTIGVAYELLETLVKHGGEGNEITVCCATWRQAKEFAYSFASDYPDPYLRRDIDKVVLQAGGTKVQFVPIGDGTKVFGKTILVVTHCVPDEVVRAIGKRPGRVRHEPEIPQEVFVVADSAEQAEKIEAMNSAESARSKKELQKLVSSKGVIGLEDLPDVLAARKTLTAQSVKAQSDRLEVNLSKFCTEGYIKLDGEKLQGVQKLSIEFEAGKHPVITMELCSVSPKQAAAG